MKLKEFREIYTGKHFMSHGDFVPSGSMGRVARNISRLFRMGFESGSSLMSLKFGAEACDGEIVINFTFENNGESHIGSVGIDSICGLTFYVSGNPMGNTDEVPCEEQMALAYYRLVAVCEDLAEKFSMFEIE